MGNFVRVEDTGVSAEARSVALSAACHALDREDDVGQVIGVALRVAHDRGLGRDRSVRLGDVLDWLAQNNESRAVTIIERAFL